MGSRGSGNYPVLLKQVRAIDPLSNSDRLADVLLAGGQIAAIAPHLENTPPETATIEGKGYILAPGLTDLYSHSGEPGWEERETLASLAAAGAAGGFTRVAVLPDTLPATDNPAALQALQQKSRSLSSQGGAKAARLDFWSALTLKGEGQQMVELAEMAAAGAIGFSDSRPLTDLALLRRLLEYLKPLGQPIALVPADPTLRGNGVMREGTASIRYGLPGDPAISESAALAAILEVVAGTGCPAHLMRISTRRGVELLAEAKGRGLPVTASTTWLHLLLEASDVGSYDPNLRLTPPLGNPEDRLALVEGVAGGAIDVIAVDHAPYAYEEKAVGFAAAPSGAIGLEFALPLLWQRFVASGKWSALQLWQALSVNPRRCLQQPPPSCAPGQPAELLLFDPNCTWTARAEQLQSLSANVPWLGEQLTGKVVEVWLPN